MMPARRIRRSPDLRSRIRLAAILAVLPATLLACTKPDQPPSTDSEPATPAIPEPEQPTATLCPPSGAQIATDEVAALAAKAEQNGSVRVIVRLNAPLLAPGIAQPAAAPRQDAALALFKAEGVERVTPIGRNLPFLVAEVTAPELRSLDAKDPSLSWSEDRIAFPTLADSGPLVGAPAIWVLGGRGAGQTVAILDTGVDSAHPFFAGRVVAEACFSTQSAGSGSKSVCAGGQPSQIGAGAAKPCAADGCDHGTHVAGIAAGRGADFSGIAPDADIIAVQVFSRFDGAACGGRPSPCVASFTSDQIRGLDFVLQQTANRKVAAVNMSLGGGRSATACDSDLTKPVIDQLRAAGAATAIASGNDGFRDSVSFPGCISTAVTVGATNKSDQLADFSNCSAGIDLNAPGVSINSSVPGGGFDAFSGTSMATPHVTGAFAALRSHYPKATVDQIEQALKGSGLDVGDRPRIRLAEADAALKAMLPADDQVNTGAEVAMIPTDSLTPELQKVLADLSALPQDESVRILVGVKSTAGEHTVAIARAETAAKKAGCDKVQRLGSQPTLVIEATPAEAKALAQSGTIASMQIDRLARPN